MCRRRDGRFDFAQGPEPVEGHRVRYFGWLHPSAKARFMQVQTLLAVSIVVATVVPLEPQWHLRCPYCAAFALVLVGTLPRHARAPPHCTQ